MSYLAVAAPGNPPRGPQAKGRLEEGQRPREAGPGGREQLRGGRLAGRQKGRAGCVAWTLGKTVRGCPPFSRASPGCDRQGPLLRAAGRAGGGIGGARGEAGTSGREGRGGGGS